MGRLRSGCVQGCGSSAGKAHGEDEDGLLNPFHPFFRSYTVVYQAFLQDRNAMEVGFARHECGVTRWGAQLVTQVGMIGPSAETSASNKLPSNKQYWNQITKDGVWLPHLCRKKEKV